MTSRKLSLLCFWLEENPRAPGGFRFAYDHGPPFPGEHEYREPLSNKENLTQVEEDAIMVANGTTNPSQAMQDLCYGNEEISFLAEFYKYVNTNSIVLTKWNTIAPQIKKTTKKEKT